MPTDLQSPSISTNTKRWACLALGACLAQSASGQIDPGDLEPGVTFRLYDVGSPMERLYDLLADQSPNVDEKRSIIDYPAQGDFAGYKDFFIVEVEAYLDVRTGGRYTLRLTSDDGSRLKINDQLVILHDGVHGTTAREGKIDLEPGRHHLYIQMFENQGGEALKLEWQTPGSDRFSLVPRNRLLTPSGAERPTSEGTKRIMYPGGPRRPGDRLPLEEVHPSWAVETVRPSDFEPRCGGIAFLPDGKLAVTTFEPKNDGELHQETNGDLWILDGVLGSDPEAVEVIHVADGLHDPSGVLYHDGALYVCDRNEIAKFTDTDGDGIPEHRESFASGWVSDNYHHFTFGLAQHDGYLYASLSTSIYFGNTIERDNLIGGTPGLNGPNPPHRGCALKISLETGEVEYIAGGLRTPNGVGIGPEGKLFISDNQGAWNPANSLYHIRRGHFYGHYNNTAAVSDPYPDGGAPSLHSEFPPTPPAIYLPQNECSNSPTNPILIPDGPFAGQLFLGELTGGGIRRVYLEKINGVYQGAVFRFSQGFEAGVQRVIWGPDGCLYVAGQGAGGNWSWRGKQFGLQRLRSTGIEAFEMKSISATPDGFNITFSQPVAKANLEDLDAYMLKQWHYNPTQNYGGSKIDEQELAVSQAVASDDGLSVKITVPGLAQGKVVYIRTDPESIDGDEIWATEAWYTLNQVPLAEAAENLIKADALDGWHAVGGGHWSVSEGVITGTASTNESRHGLLVSDREYDDFIAEYEYRVIEGDSGFYFRVEETGDTVGVRGFQVEVDDVEPGGLYETSGRAWVVKPDPTTAKRWHSSQEWNHVRLTANGTSVRVEVNGVVTAELADDEQGRRSGHFALQLHGSQDMNVQFRNIRVLELDP